MQGAPVMCHSLQDKPTLGEVIDMIGMGPAQTLGQRSAVMLWSDLFVGKLKWLHCDLTGIMVSKAWKWNQLVGGLEHVLFFQFFHTLGIIVANWLSYFSKGLKPPTSQESILKLMVKLSRFEEHATKFHWWTALEVDGCHLPWPVGGKERPVQ